MSEIKAIQKRVRDCYGGKLIAHAHVDMTTLMSERETIRQLLLRAAGHCPSTAQCLIGDRTLLSENCRITLEAVCDALELLTGSRGNFENAQSETRHS